MSIGQYVSEFLNHRWARLAADSESVLSVDVHESPSGSTGSPVLYHSETNRRHYDARDLPYMPLTARSSFRSRDDSDVEASHTPHIAIAEPLRS